MSPTPARERLGHHARLVHRQVAQRRNELGEHARGLRTAVALPAPTVAITGFLPVWRTLAPECHRRSWRGFGGAAGVVRPGSKALFITRYAENALVGSAPLEAGLHVMTKPLAMDALAVRIPSDRDVL